MPQTYDPSADYRGTLSVPDGSSREAWVITASATNQAKYVRSLHINNAGTVSGVLVDQADDTALDYTVAAGPLPYAFRRITACPANTIGHR